MDCPSGQFALQEMRRKQNHAGTYSPGSVRHWGGSFAAFEPGIRG
jgi:hypothetical protein